MLSRERKDGPKIGGGRCCLDRPLSAGGKKWGKHMLVPGSRDMVDILEEEQKAEHETLKRNRIFAELPKYFLLTIVFLI